ncbi:peptidoglycan-binding domain 1 protein [Cylindrospermum sp. NIES-4074]|nr:peptidoglycan-binding domain 1 protein [Cylindrospermum sp. NIES-4074]
MLNTNQPPPPNLPDQSPFHQEIGERKSANILLSRLVSTPQIIPPEFMPIDASSPTTLSTLKRKNDKILRKIKTKYVSSDSPILADALKVIRTGTTGEKITTKFPDLKSPSLPSLGFGNSGISVRVLQRLLISNGYSMRVDGVFGPLTETAVKAFQNQRNLGADGIVGQRTWRELTI